MTKTEKVKSFVKSFVAHVQGDSSVVLAEKVYRQADAALASQIALEKAELIQAESILEAAVEARTKAVINNGSLIANMTEYVDGILIAENAVTEAEEALDARKEKIKFLEKTLDGLKTEVEAAIN